MRAKNGQELPSYEYNAGCGEIVMAYSETQLVDAVAAHSRRCSDKSCAAAAWRWAAARG